MLGRLTWGVLFSALALAGCEVVGGGVCTLVGCSDGVHGTVAPESGVWEEGEYRLEVVPDGAKSTCQFAVPADLPKSGTITTLDCGSAATATLWARTECTTTQHGDAVSHTCDPLPDQYELQVDIDGTPSKLAVRLTRGSDTVLDDSRTLSYEETSPNGPECGPTCRQAGFELSVAYP